MLTAAMLLLGTTNANANVLGSASEDASKFGGSTGGNATHRASCATNSVVVGISTNGTSGVAVWCRALQSDGTLPLNDNTSSNSTKVNVWGSTSTNVFCPAGKAATSLRIRVNGYPTGSGLNCQTPPTFQDTSVLSPVIDGSGSWVTVSCPTGQVVAGAWAVTGAWLDRIGARCAPFNFLTVTYNTNGGTGTAPATQTQTTVAGSIPISAQGNVARNGYRFGGWNTLANGTGTTLAPSTNFTPSANTTLFARWESTITYDGNTSTGG